MPNKKKTEQHTLSRKQAEWYVYRWARKDGASPKVARELVQGRTEGLKYDPAVTKPATYNQLRMAYLFDVRFPILLAEKVALHEAFSRYDK